MNYLSFVQRWRALVGFVGFVGFAALPACGKSNGSTIPACGDQSTADGGLPDPDSPASGTVEGAGVSVGLCDVGVVLVGTPSQTSLSLQTGTATSATVVQPAGGVSGSLTGSVTLPAGTPGTYKSSDASCGGFTFSYGVPLASDCTPDGSFSCSAGCTYTSPCPESSTTYGCCTPLATTYIYQANISSGCGGQALPPLGSWTVTLTSAEATDAGAYEGQNLSVPHGTLKASLVGTTGKFDTMNLSLSF